MTPSSCDPSKDYVIIRFTDVSDEESSDEERYQTYPDEIEEFEEKRTFDEPRSVVAQLQTLCWSTDVYGTDFIMKRGAELYIHDYIQETDNRPQAHYLKWKLLLLERHPTPHPSSSSTLSTVSSGCRTSYLRLTDEELRWAQLAWGQLTNN